MLRAAHANRDSDRYQVLNGLGVIFSIPYPDNYTELLSSISAIELDMPSLLPIDCLLGGINFTHTLVLQTAGPLFVILLLELLGRTLRKASAKAATRAEETGGPEPAGSFVAELCSNVSFFLLFLLYPGSSTKIFNALLCVGFNGEGEDGERFLRVDFSIDCDSPLYVGFILPYALGMVSGRRRAHSRSSWAGWLALLLLTSLHPTPARFSSTPSACPSTTRSRSSATRKSCTSCAASSSRPSPRVSALSLAPCFGAAS